MWDNVALLFTGDKYHTIITMKQKEIIPLIAKLIHYCKERRVPIPDFLSNPNAPKHVL